MKTLRFTSLMNAPRAAVWQTMLDPESYRIWTAGFMEGSYYEGSWAAGAGIRFLGPGGNGIASRIAECRRHDFISIQHLSEIQGGVETPYSGAMFENYTFREAGAATELVVDMDVLPEFEACMAEMWPRALAILKHLCESSAPAAHELVLARRIDASPDKLYRAWTEPELLKRWFAPKPWTVPTALLDVRPGGASLIVMRGPEGQYMPCRGVYLEVAKNERLVFTDAYTNAWAPAEKPFMTGIVTFEPEGRGTRYTARVRHWTAGDREAHEKMGFHEGWGQCADQLTALVAEL